MELEFTKTDISHYDLVYDTVCSREETLEMIVQTPARTSFKWPTHMAFACSVAGR